MVTRRVRTLLLGGVLFVVLFVAALTLPVPYVVLSPGPTYNTLGKDQGAEVIVLHGKASQPVSGHLNMTTVSVSTDDSISVVEAIKGWLENDEIVVPRSAVYPPGQSQQDVDQQNAQDFTDSRTSAVAAAMCELGYPKGFGIVDVTDKSKAKGLLKPGDELLTLDGQPISSVKTLSAVLAKQKPGARVQIVVARGTGTKVAVPVTLIAPQTSGQKGASIGISVADGCLGPFTVDISLADVGGPSAGMMFALGIIDEAGTRDLTGGAFIAGTGTIDGAGSVGPIGGIQLKMIAARRAGATVFLAPSGNCSDVRGHVPHGLQVVKVSTLHGAVQALLDLQQHKAVPGC